MRMTEALGTATEVVARTLVSALALPSAKQFDRVPAEPARQILKGEFAVSLRVRQVHRDVVGEVKHEPSTEPALQPAIGREDLCASLCGVSLYRMPDILSHANYPILPNFHNCEGSINPPKWIYQKVKTVKSPIEVANI